MELIGGIPYTQTSYLLCFPLFSLVVGIYEDGYLSS